MGRSRRTGAQQWMRSSRNCIKCSMMEEEAYGGPEQEVDWAARTTSLAPLHASEEGTEGELTDGAEEEAAAMPASSTRRRCGRRRGGA